MQIKLIKLVENYNSTYGGGQVYVKNIVSALYKVGIDVVVISLYINKGSKKTHILQRTIEGVTVLEISIPQTTQQLTGPLELSEEVCQSLASVIRDIQPDVIHAHGWKSTAAKVAHGLGIPCVITAHHGGLVCPNGLLMNDKEQLCKVPVSQRECLTCALNFVPGGHLWTPIIKAATPKLRKRVGRSLRGKTNIPYTTPAWLVPQGIDHKLQQLEAIRSYASMIIAPSRTISEALLRNGFPEKQIQVMPHGVRPVDRRPIASGFPGRPLRLGYVGRINYIKGLHLVLHAMKQLSNQDAVEFHVYGEAATRSEKKYQQRLLADAKNLNVVWHGKIAHDRIDAAYHQMDVLLLTSICTEIYGLTVAEALSAGRPVIASRCGGPEDMIVDGHNGFLVPPNEAEAIAKVIQRFIHNPELLQRLALNTKTPVTLDRHVRELLRLYESLIDSKS